MILLDSDHVTVLRYPENEKYVVLRDRMESTLGEAFATTVITLEEQMRGWLAFIAKLKDVAAQVTGYDRLLKMLDFFRSWDVVRFDARAAEVFKRLRKQGVRIGTQDPKIAAIALANDALLLSANLRDFQKVPSLRVENWLA